jgi:hypothetical protein
MEQRKELAYERHELPSRFWEPVPPEDFESEQIDDTEELELPFD